MTFEDQYRGIREGAVVAAVSPSRQIAVAGRDRASFLQGLLTNDVQSLAPGEGCYSAWLTPQGRMLTDMHVLQGDTMILLDVPLGTAAATLARLDQFLFAEDVQLASLADSLTGVWVHGPTAAATLERLVDGAAEIGSWPDYRHAPLGFNGSPVVVARIDQLDVPGFCVFLEPVREAALVAALTAAGAVLASPDAIEIARVEAGYPLFGVDMTEETIPLEAGIEARAISTTKGCYVGQEIIIRVLHRGQGRVAKKLVALRVQGAPPARGARILAGERDVGAVTSAAVSPRFGAIALGYVHRDFTTAGTSVTLEGTDARVSAAVTSRPLTSAS